MKHQQLISLLIFLILLTISCSISFEEREEPDLDLTRQAIQGNSSQQSVGLDTNCDFIVNIKDVTYPDGSEVNPGETFTKTWSMQNGGTCTWTTGYGVAQVSELDFSIMEWYPLNQTVTPGSTANVSVPVHAPLKKGGVETYYYMLVNESGQVFGYDTGASKPFWVNFKITGDSQTSDSPNESASGGQEEEIPCYRYGKARDVTMPDGTKMGFNERADKKWELTNTGTCPWEEDFQLIFVGGDPIVTIEATYINQHVEPGESAIVWVPIVTVEETGTFTSYWKMRTATGQVFGGGEDGDASFWVQIVVEDEAQPQPLPPEPEPEVIIDWGMQKMSWVGIGMCPIGVFDPQLNLTLTSSKDREVAYDFELAGTWSAPPPEKTVKCYSPNNNNRFVKDLKANQPASITMKIKECDISGYVEGNIIIRVYNAFTNTKLVESSLPFEHTCGK